MVEEDWGNGGKYEPEQPPTQDDFEEDLTDYITSSDYGTTGSYEEVLSHVHGVTASVQMYAPTYARDFSFFWKPDTLSYFYATILIESQFGMAMYEDPRTGAVHGVYFGRGYSQLTGEDNYREMGENFGVDLIGNPDLAARDLDLSARIAMRCMIVGKCGPGSNLNTYFQTDGSYDYVGAQNIINPGAPSAETAARLATDIRLIVDEYWQVLNLPSED